MNKPVCVQRIAPIAADDLGRFPLLSLGDVEDTRHGVTGRGLNIDCKKIVEIFENFFLKLSRSSLKGTELGEW
jgi:hypothetical protein